MTAVGSQEPDDLLPHSCHHCKGFVVHLFDGPGEGRTDTPIWHSPNPSQERLATNLYGDDFWTAEWAEYREYFFRRTNGISFLIVCKEDLKRFSADGCLLSRRFAQSLRDDELPRKYAIGMQMPTAYSIELRALDLEGMTSEMLLGGDDDEDPDNVYTVMANRGLEMPPEVYHLYLNLILVVQEVLWQKSLTAIPSIRTPARMTLWPELESGFKTACRITVPAQSRTRILHLHGSFELISEMENCDAN